ncbi:hypothetical protein, partial [Candidatus Ichthyocystis sparus]|uniref:hypothetical protein n=1 Tax=Candidatus Ichthyocystis sparus TaxID=1561004 RepID=UPI0011464E0D
MHYICKHSNCLDYSIDSDSELEHDNEIIGGNENTTLVVAEQIDDYKKTNSSLLSRIPSAYILKPLVILSML